MRVLGIDPGYDRIGIAIIEKELNQKEVLVYSECFETDKDAPIHERIFAVCEHLQILCTKHSPTELAIELLYFANNAKTVMGVSEARGAIVYAAKQQNLSVSEYTPPQIKAAITSSGRADKKQVMAMLPHLIAIPEGKRKDDEYDAIAVALTHLAHRR